MTNLCAMPVPDHLVERARALVAAALLRGTALKYAAPVTCNACAVTDTDTGTGIAVWTYARIVDRGHASWRASSLWTCKHCGAMAYDASSMFGTPLELWLDAIP